MKRHKMIAVMVISSIILVLFFAGTVIMWKSISDIWNNITDCSQTFQANWGFKIPSEAQCEEIYCKTSEAAFHGDGIRYHIFSYKINAPIENVFHWQSSEHRTFFCSSYSIAVKKWLWKIKIPDEQHPDYENCVYWYQASEDHSELIVLWDRREKKLYIAESFL